MSRTFDIAIAGGNHSGLTLALALTEVLGSGVRVAIVERADLGSSADGPPDPRAFALSDGSRRLLSAIGVWPQLADAAQPVTAIDITDSALDHAVRPILLNYDNSTAGGVPASFIVEAKRLKAALIAKVRAVADVTLLTPRSVTGFEADAAGVTVRLDTGERVGAQLLVAADGGRSPIRQSAGIKSTHWSAGQVGIVTTVTHDRPHNGRAVQHFLPSGPFAILPLIGHRSCITWSELADGGRDIVAGTDQQFQAEIERRFDYRLGEVRVDGPRALWPLEFHVARSMIATKLALIGDAARTVHPIAGQGLNLAFRDVAALVDCVADALQVGLAAGDLTALDRYEQWRRFDANMSAAAFGALNALFSNDQPIVRAVRDAGLGLVNQATELKQALVREAAGLSGELPRLMQSPA